jgi:hypothetical protein
MVLLSEQERLYADELQVLNDAGPYNQTSITDWTTKKSAGFTLSKQLIVMLKATFVADAGTTTGSDVCGNGRITVDGVPVWSSGYLEGQASGPQTQTATSPDIYVLLAAGLHTVNFDVALYYTWASGWKVYVSNMYIGQLNFNDKLSGGPWDSGSVALSAGVQATLVNQNITVPAGRVLPNGQIINYGLFVYVVGLDVSASPSRRSHMKNAGESDDSGSINFRLYINSAETGWTSRAQDDGQRTANPTYGRGAQGNYYTIAAINQTLNVQVRALCSGAANAECYVFAFLCPWVLPPLGKDYAVVNLVFPQGSVFYAILEPLYVDTTKSSKIGMKRFKSLGDSTDYYSVVSGTGILQHSYTLDVVDVPSAVWNVNPATDVVCISYVAVDAK